WIRTNAKRYWRSARGPLSLPGADVVNIDDPQMAALIPLIKKALTEVKIIYRSHIEVSKDLVAIPGIPQQQVSRWPRNYVKEADVFIGHLVERFVLYQVPLAMVGLMLACIDWFIFLASLLIVLVISRNHLLYPERESITQITGFDPSKGIPDVIESWSKSCAHIIRDAPESVPPRLLMYSGCGHGDLDGLDAEIVYNETIALLRLSKYAAIAKDVIVVRIGPSDQILNAMITTAKIVVQLPLREGFEVKVSDALHHGTPVVSKRTGGILLQIERAKSEFLLDVSDTDSVAKHLFDLYTNDDLYERTSNHGRAGVSDAVGTIGNSPCCLYLAAKHARGEGFSTHTRWIMDMAMEEAGQKYESG
ncbi:clock-controlled-9 protein, partial [Tuber brumale]